MLHHIAWYRPHKVVCSTPPVPLRTNMRINLSPTRLKGAPEVATAPPQSEGTRGGGPYHPQPGVRRSRQLIAVNRWRDTNWYVYCCGQTFSYVFSEHLIVY